ncbi:helix-turn-helix domain-containing protein [Streptomyces kronopolitis]|uniref:helix-turn-helix domain-containing protein n=1 Tax=Streptomyces kronopolitis TaxID=1612435 RepID=UPI0036C2524D
MGSDPKERQEDLQKLISSFRAAVDPESHGIRKRRRKNQCSQSDMAYLLNITAQTYAGFENGVREPSDELLLDFARVCGLNKAQEDALWNAVRRHPLPPRYAPMAGMQVSDDYRDLVLGDDRNMAYLTDAVWNLLACNDLWAGLFRDGPPQNVMRWMVLSDEARGGDDFPHPVLTRWDEEWAPYVLGRLGSTYNALGDRIDSLSQLVRDVRADERAGPIFANAYRTPRSEGGQSGLRQPIHPDGDQRPLRHPLWGDGFVRMCSMEPQGSPLACYMVVKFSKTYRKGRTLLTAEGPLPRA